MKGNNAMNNTKINTDDIIISLTDSYDNTYDATLLTIFEAGLNNQNYAAVLSHVPDDNGQLPIQIFRCSMTEENGIDGIELDNIRSDMEFDEAYDVLMSLIE